LERIVRGEASKAIARDFGISIKTVETHRLRLMRRLGARNLVDLGRMVERADRSVDRGRDEYES
jgi:FixJ family two-component response regulator